MDLTPAERGDDHRAAQGLQTPRTIVIDRTDEQLAALVADEAGDLLRSVRVSLTALGESEKAIGKAGDVQSNQLILHRLREERPNDAILSEESRDDLDRLQHDRVWIVDPLDGTREYSEGRDDWAVHVALFERGHEITAAAVAMPGVGQLHRSDQPETPPPFGPHGTRMVVSRSRPPAIVEPVAAAVGARVVTLGSAGAKAMAVLTGGAEIYLHAGGQWEWDSAAPVGVALACGLHASRIDGSPLRYNQADPYLPDLLVCRVELAEQVLAAIAAA
jgi:3'(2'), 5'-bisphosphate nucleotidase